MEEKLHVEGSVRNLWHQLSAVGCCLVAQYWLPVEVASGDLIVTAWKLSVTASA